MNADAKNVGEQLELPDSPVFGLLRRARWLADMEQIFRERVSPATAKALRIANFRNGTVVIYVDSAAALTQLRYSEKELLQALENKIKMPCRKLEIKVRSASTRTPLT